MINLYHRDCMEAMAEMADGAYDLAIVDHPYGINVAKMAYTQEDNRPCKQRNGSILRVKKLKYKHGDWDKNIPTIKYFNELKRVSKNQIIWGWNYYGLDWGAGLIKWNKLVPEGVSFSKCEYAYCSLLDREVEFDYLWTGFSQGISLVRPYTQRGNKKLNEKRIHPTHKPIVLYQYLLKEYAKPGDKILDTHLGSGSIAIACHDYGFSLDGFEIDADYYRDALKRLKTHQSQGKLF